MENLCTIYVVRHGESEHNIAFNTQKEAPKVPQNSQLTKKGIEQAKKIAKRFKSIHFDAIFSSDFIRAKRTAEIITLEHKLAIITKEALRERHFGSLENRLSSQLRDEMEEIIEKLPTEEEKMNYKYVPDMESDEECAVRFITFLRETAIANVGKTILIVCHGNIMRRALVKFGFASYNELPKGSIVNTGYFILESDGVDFFVKETWGVNKKEL